MIIEALFGVLAMAATKSCNEIPQSHRESEAIVAMAGELFSDRPANSEFESAKIDKCAETNELKDGRRSRWEKTTLYGRFSDRSNIPDTRIHDAVTCVITLEAISGIPDGFNRRCYRTIETFLTFPGIHHDISVAEGSDLGAVRQYLGYLSRQVGSMVGDRVFTEEEFINISRVSVSSNSRVSHFYATYSVTEAHCKTLQFKATATGEAVYEFLEIERIGMVC